MKLITLFIFLIITVNNLEAQHHDNTWLIGRETTSSTKLNFNGGLQIDSIIRNMPMSRAGISMSDSLGNLIFYSNGIKVNNAQNQLMQNGDSLNPGQIADDNLNSGYVLPNGLISIPHPNQTDKYYLFHQSLTYASDLVGLGEHLYYTLIDVTANNGLGRVEKKNQILSSDSIGRGQLQAVKHGNGKDWWLVQPMAWSNGFQIFLVTGDTIIYQHKQYIGNLHNLSHAWKGQAVFSPNGNVYARYDSENDLDIYAFDRCSGLFSNSLHIPILDTLDMFSGGGSSFVGTAISPNNQYLYVSSYNLVYQFDLASSNITASKDTIAIFDGYWDGFVPTTFSFMQLAPDNKIYILPLSTMKLHVVEDPNQSGINCNIQQHSITLPYRNVAFLPNHPHYRTPALTGSPCDTITNTVTIKESNSNIKIYPNPASTTITLESGKMIEKIRIYTAIGQEVFYQTKVEQFSLDVDTRSFENGTYFISLWVEGEVLNQQFQVLR